MFYLHGSKRYLEAKGGKRASWGFKRASWVRVGPQNRAIRSYLAHPYPLRASKSISFQHSVESFFLPSSKRSIKVARAKEEANGWRPGLWRLSACLLAAVERLIESLRDWFKPSRDCCLPPCAMKWRMCPKKDIRYEGRLTRTMSQLMTSLPGPLGLTGLLGNIPDGRYPQSAGPRTPDTCFHADPDRVAHLPGLVITRTGLASSIGELVNRTGLQVHGLPGHLLFITARTLLTVTGQGYWGIGDWFLLPGTTYSICVPL